jgi:hypothetical protein
MHDAINAGQARLAAGGDAIFYAPPCMFRVENRE